jgi:hypothetical protein
VIERTDAQPDIHNEPPLDSRWDDRRLLLDAPEERRSEPGPPELAPLSSAHIAEVWTPAAAGAAASIGGEERDVERSAEQSPPVGTASRSVARSRDTAPLAVDPYPPRPVDAPDSRRRFTASALAGGVAASLVVGLGIGYWLGTRPPHEERSRRLTAGEAQTTVALEDQTIPAPEASEVIGPTVPEDEGRRPRAAPPPSASERAPDTASGTRHGAIARTREPVSSRARGAAGAAPASASRPVLEGRMLVRSSPADALVRVNGVERGRTPLALRNLEYGRYHVAAVLPGHVLAEREVSITPQSPATALTFDLVRATARSAPTAAATESELAASPQRGAAAGGRVETSLEVVSRPSGARVFIDGQPIGVTPLRVSGLAAASHTVRLELSGFRPWTAAVDLASRRRTQVSASLEPSAVPR